MLDHLGILVTDYAASQAFYEKTLAALGATKMMEFGPEITRGHPTSGFGKDGKPDFWITGSDNPIASPSHVAFSAPDTKTVDAWYAAAIAAGGKDNGKPGLRAHYHPRYYGAFVTDLSGHNIEVVCHCATPAA